MCFLEQFLDNLDIRANTIKKWEKSPMVERIFMNVCAYIFISQDLSPFWWINEIQDLQLRQIVGGLIWVNLSFPVELQLRQFPSIFVSFCFEPSQYEKKIDDPKRFTSLNIPNKYQFIFNLQKNFLSSRMRMDCFFKKQWNTVRSISPSLVSF